MERLPPLKWSVSPRSNGASPLAQRERLPSLKGNVCRASQHFSLLPAFPSASLRTSRSFCCQTKTVRGRTANNLPPAVNFPCGPQQFACGKLTKCRPSSIHTTKYSRPPVRNSLPYSKLTKCRPVMSFTSSFPVCRAPPRCPSVIRVQTSAAAVPYPPSPCLFRSHNSHPRSSQLPRPLRPPRRAPASLPDKPERLRYPIHPPHHHTTARTIVIRAPPSSPPAATPYAARDRHVVQVSRTRNLKRTGGRRRAGRKECNRSAVRCKFAMQQNCITTTLVVPKGGGAREENCGLRTLSWFPPLQRQARRAKKNADAR